MISILSLVANIFGPAEKLIDNLHTSDEERAKAKIQIQKLQNEAMGAALEFEQQRMKAQASIIEAEAKGQSWLQRNWRPITMLTFLALVVADSFGLLAFRLSAEAWVLLQIGLGGYVVGRSAEKIAPMVKKGAGNAG